MEIKAIGFNREEDQPIIPPQLASPEPTGDLISRINNRFKQEEQNRNNIRAMQEAPRSPLLSTPYVKSGLTAWEYGQLYDRMFLENRIPREYSTTDNDIPLSTELASVLSRGGKERFISDARRLGLVVDPIESVSKVTALVSNFQLAAESYKNSIASGRRWVFPQIVDEEDAVSKFFREERIKELTGKAMQLDNEALENITNALGSLYGVVKEGFFSSKGRFGAAAAAAIATRGLAIPIIFGQDIFFATMGGVADDAYYEALERGQDELTAIALANDVMRSTGLADAIVQSALGSIPFGSLIGRGPARLIWQKALSNSTKNAIKKRIGSLSKVQKTALTSIASGVEGANAEAVAEAADALTIEYNRSYVAKQLGQSFDPKYWDAAVNAYVSTMQGMGVLFGAVGLGRVGFAVRSARIDAKRANANTRQTASDIADTINSNPDITSTPENKDATKEILTDALNGQVHNTKLGGPVDGDYQQIKAVPEGSITRDNLKGFTEQEIKELADVFPAMNDETYSELIPINWDGFVSLAVENNALAKKLADKLEVFPEESLKRIEEIQKRVEERETAEQTKVKAIADALAAAKLDQADAELTAPVVNTMWNYLEKQGLDRSKFNLSFIAGRTNTDARGSLGKTKSGGYAIRLFKGADASTVLHENFHFVTDIMFKMNKSDSALFAKEIQAIRDFLGVKSNALSLNKVQMEGLAEAWEGFLTSSHFSPDKLHPLAKVFKLVKDAIVSIYKTILGKTEFDAILSENPALLNFFKQLVDLDAYTENVKPVLDIITELSLTKAAEPAALPKAAKPEPSRPVDALETLRQVEKEKQEQAFNALSLEEKLQVVMQRADERTKQIAALYDESRSGGDEESLSEQITELFNEQQQAAITVQSLQEAIVEERLSLIEKLENEVIASNNAVERRIDELLATETAEADPSQQIIDQIKDLGGIDRAEALAMWGEETVAEIDANHPGLIPAENGASLEDAAMAAGVDESDLATAILASPSLDYLKSAAIAQQIVEASDAATPTKTEIDALFTVLSGRLNALSITEIQVENAVDAASIPNENIEKAQAALEQQLEKHKDQARKVRSKKPKTKKEKAAPADPSPEPTAAPEPAISEPAANPELERIAAEYNTISDRLNKLTKKRKHTDAEKQETKDIISRLAELEREKTQIEAQTASLAESEIEGEFDDELYQSSLEQQALNIATASSKLRAVNKRNKTLTALKSKAQRLIKQTPYIEGKNKGMFPLEWSNQIKQLIVDAKLSRTKKTFATESLTAFIDRYKAEFPVLSGWFFANDFIRSGAYTVGYKKLDQHDTELLSGALDILARLARESKKQSSEVFKAAADAKGLKLAEAAYNTFKGKSKPNPKNPIMKYIRLAASELIKIEPLVRIMDGLSDDNFLKGVWHSAIYQPIEKAYENQLIMQKAYADKIMAAFEHIPKEQREGLRKTLVSGTGDALSKIIPVPDWWRTKHYNIGGLVLTREEMLSIALNSGTPGGVKAMNNGNGFSNDVIAEVWETLTAEEVKFIKAVWDGIEPLFDPLADVVLRTEGRVLKKEDGMLISTRKHGVIQGKYYPEVFDRDDPSNQRYNMPDNVDAYPPPPYMTDRINPSLESSASLRRTGAAKGALLLNLGVIDKHISDAIHDITHRESITEINNIISNAHVRKAVRDTMGDEYNLALKKWLWWQARPRYSTDGFIDKAAEVIRRNVSTATMGFKMSVALMQLTGGFQSAELVGAGNFLRGLMQSLFDPEMRKWVKTNSAVLRDRHSAVPSELVIADAVRDISFSGFKNPKQKFTEWAFTPIRIMDGFIADATYIAGYNKAISEGKSQDEASIYADYAVRATQPLSAPKDAAAIQHGSTLSRLLTMYYTFFNGLHNRLVLRGYQTYLGKIKLQEMVVTAAFTCALPAVADYLISHRELPQDEDDYWEMAGGMISYSVSGIPFIRDAVRQTIGGYQGRGDPVSEALKTLQNAWTSKEPDKIAKATATILGVPGTAQANASMRAYIELADMNDYDITAVLNLILGPPARK
jgi:hypothetical protein